MNAEGSLTGLQRGAADLRAEIEAARRALAEAAEALAARTAAPDIETPPEPELAPESVTVRAELVPTSANLPVPYRPAGPRRRSTAVAGAVLAIAALLVRRRLSR